MLPGEALRFRIVLAVGAYPSSSGLALRLGGSRTAGADDRVLRLGVTCRSSAARRGTWSFYLSPARCRRSSAGRVTSRLGWGAVALFAIVFLLDPAPIFWACRSIAAANTRPPTCRGCKSRGRAKLSARWCLYTLMLWPATLRLLSCSAVAGPLYGIVACVLSLRVHRDRNPGVARERRGQRRSTIHMFHFCTNLSPFLSSPHPARRPRRGGRALRMAGCDDYPRNTR